MKKWALLLICTQLFAARPPYGLSTTEICCPASRCEGYARALYWKTCVPAFPFVIQNDQVKTIRPEYKLGFQIGARLLSPNWLTVAEGDYTQIDNRTKRTATGDIIPTGTGKTNAEFLIRYKTGNLVGGRYIYQLQDFGLYTYVGGRYSNIIEETRNFGRVQRIQFEGGGPEFGVGGRSGSLCGFQAVGKFSLFGIIGKRTEKVTVDKNLRNKTRSNTICVPGILFRMSVTYTHRARQGWEFVGEIGYEIDHYFQAIEKNDVLTVPAKADPVFLFTSKHNVTFCGPFAGLRVRY